MICTRYLLKNESGEKVTVLLPTTIIKLAIKYTPFLAYTIILPRTLATSHHSKT